MNEHEYKNEMAPDAPAGFSGYRTDAERDLERIKGLVAILPVDERDAVLTAWADAQTPEHQACILALVYAMRRSELRRRSDREGDRRRRRIVGARLPREVADLCKCAADHAGLSLNKWCAELIVKALASTPYRLGAAQEVRYVRQEWEGDDTYGYWC